MQHLQGQSKKEAHNIHVYGEILQIISTQSLYITAKPKLPH